MLKEQSKPGGALTKNSSTIDKLIHAGEGKPITEYDRQEINKLLLMLVKYVGILPQYYPDKLTKNMLISHLLGNYGDLTVSEITLAFSMAVAGKLHVDAKPYNSFDAIYLSKVLDAFKKMKYDEITNHRKKLPKKESGPTKEEIYKIMKDGILEYFSQYKEGKANHIKPSIFYEFCHEQGLMDVDESSDEFKEGVEKARQELVEERKVKARHSLSKRELQTLVIEMKRLAEGSDLENMVLNRARTNCLHEYFDKLIWNHKELSELLD